MSKFQFLYELIEIGSAMDIKMNFRVLVLYCQPEV